LLAVFERVLRAGLFLAGGGAGAGAAGADNCPDDWSRFISRALRRAALLRWTTPLETARSSAEMATVTSSSTPSAPSAMPRRNLVTFVLTADLIDRLRCARITLRFASFFEESLLARDRPPVWGSVRS
jgi:hypothetical protein